MPQKITQCNSNNLRADAVRRKSVLNDAKRRKSRPFLETFGPDGAVPTGPARALPVDFTDRG